MTKETATSLAESGKLDLGQLIEIGERTNYRKVWWVILHIIKCSFLEELYNDSEKCKRLQIALARDYPDLLEGFFGVQKDGEIDL